MVATHRGQRYPRRRRKTALTLTENVRPVLEKENLGPARAKIHDLFLEHVMAQAPGYKKLISWAGAPIMPTPAAVGRIMETIAQKQGINLIGVDIGGATTDVFSVFQGIFNRTVSANQEWNSLTAHCTKCRSVHFSVGRRIEVACPVKPFVDRSPFVERSRRPSQEQPNNGRYR